ncbi:MAG: putative hydrolase [Ilumatobacteraceae bacterium]|nr:putative hydrolase [Ilumatobacteraceae bacterium]
MSIPVVLVHGWGGSFLNTWQKSGFTALLEDADRTVIGVDLLGHGQAPKPHEPEAYADLTTRIIDALPDEPVDAVGFSLGALTLLRLACDQPHRFNRLVLAGIGENVFADHPTTGSNIVEALAGNGDPGDNISRLFVQYADQPGNDRAALLAVMQRPSRGPFTVEELAKVTCPTLVAIGDLDFAGPGDRLAAALPNSTLATLRKVDHFATTEAFSFIDAALEFLDAAPG